MTLFFPFARLSLSPGSSLLLGCFASSLLSLLLGVFASLLASLLLGLFSSSLFCCCCCWWKGSCPCFWCHSSTSFLLFSSSAFGTHIFLPHWLLALLTLLLWLWDLCLCFFPFAGVSEELAALCSSSIIGRPASEPLLSPQSGGVGLFCLLSFFLPLLLLLFVPLSQGAGLLWGEALFSLTPLGWGDALFNLTPFSSFSSSQSQLQTWSEYQGLCPLLQVYCHQPSPPHQSSSSSSHSSQSQPSSVVGVGGAGAVAWRWALLCFLLLWLSLFQGLCQLCCWKLKQPAPPSIPSTPCFAWEASLFTRVPLFPGYNPFPR